MEKDKLEADKLHKIRHSLSHVLAKAVKGLYPQAKLAIGPVIDNGFYYDIDFGKEKISSDDLEKIEKDMKAIINQNLEFKSFVLGIDEAIDREKKLEEKYKVELIEDLKKAGEKEVSYYQVGDFVDLCKGPHVENTQQIDTRAFSLFKLAGAYWRGDENREMLTRIYGLAFLNKKELLDYKKMLEEAEKRDHRKLGKELGLFVFSDVVGKGLPMLTEKGASMRRTLEKFIVDEEIKRGYRHVITPDLAKLELYKKSGHYPYYKDSMYAPIKIDEEEFMLRPMACPHHFEMYLTEPRSYRDLPFKMAELAKLYRYEQSGELSGLMRVRSFCLADAHIICADNRQAKEEVAGVLDLIDFVCQKLGLEPDKDYWYRLSLGDRQDEKKYHKNDKAWDEAESSLRQLLKDKGSKFVEAEAEAAFYGPKIDVQMKNVLGKEDTAFTVQWDFVMPERFKLVYTSQAGKEERAIVIHRSSIGAIERVMAFLIEFYAGRFPLWLSPVQVKLISVGEKHIEAVKSLSQEFKEQGIRSEIDISDETVGNKIRKSASEKIPYILVIGDKEVNSSKLAIRVRGEKDMIEIEKAEFIKKIKQEIEDFK
ncbi:MAG: threonine--tRNA ligase [Candidatus Pacebacteria bacterium]|nr:threonine--tRNA ligase [Candidatus Paceibacterota bacterium]